jgi:hypothetical protein
MTDITKQKWNSRKLVGFLLMFINAAYFTLDGLITGAEWIGFAKWLFLIFIFAEVAVKLPFLNGQK